MPSGARGAKTEAGNRKVFLDAETAELLREHRKAQLRQRMQAGPEWHDHDLVFCQPDGRPWNPDYVSRRIKRLAADAGVPVITLHEAGRHTGNSLMRDADVAPAGKSSVLVGANAWARPMLRAMAAGGALVRQGDAVAW